ncbi:hydroxyacid oxidase 1 [Ixodes scapularis]|uniref:hydroxyacid oxidase 1 n=1 Tax=Ixodes scapularis TaxID=6945 RepID=UPI001A9F07B2|nr:hydroxyacid oxidase 1 [Ixodes scapularis]
MAYLRLRLRPRVLKNVAQRNMEVTLLGDQRLSMPLAISPTAFQKMAHSDGELATARAARRAGTLMVLSIYSTTSFEDVRQAAPEGLQWFQLYISPDREVTKALVIRAEKAGYRALVVTVDLPVPGKSSSKTKSGFKPPRVPNFEGTSVNPSEVYKELVLDPSLTWDAISWLKSITELPIILKGITTAEDAEEAISRGVSAILVSNHGGRQLDGVPATVEVLPGVVAAVRGRIEVYVDGGIRRGTDVIKALALGAKVVFVGRPAIWGLAYKGEAGINQMLEILREEIDRTLALMGCSSLDQLRPDMVVHESHFSKPSRFLPATSNGSD